jgi:menaquinone-dependent protoporphyrinogen IX oxidase
LSTAQIASVIAEELNGRGTRKTLEARGVDCYKPYDYRDWEAIRAWARAL